MKSITLFLLAVWVCCVPDLSFAQIKIKQWLNKSEYVEGEPVFLFAKAKNFSNTSVNFGLPSATTEIHIYDNQGKRYEPTITSHYINVANLFPDSVYESFVDLASKYGENTGGLFFPYFRMGTYYVYLCWKDKGMEVTTPKIYFTVRKPDERQQNIFDEFLKVLKIRQTMEH